jgi:hypothetical protein
MKNRKSGLLGGGPRKPAGGKRTLTPASAEGKPSKGAPGASRRRFVLGGGAMAPVMVTLAGRPALANVCTVSGTLSGNLSRPDAVDCRGLSPEFWRTHPGQWPAYVTGPCNPLCGTTGTCTDYSVPTTDELAKAIKKKKLKKSAVDAYLAAPKGTKFSTVFGVGLTESHKLTLMQALWGDGVSGSGSGGYGGDDDDDDDGGGGSGGGDDDDDDDDDNDKSKKKSGKDSDYGCSDGTGPVTVLAHAVAAILNSIHFGAEQFGFTEAEIVHMVATMIAGGQTEQLLADLQLLNGRG